MKYVIVDAINGSNLNENQKRLMSKYIKQNTLSSGQIGCFLSHVTLWKHIVKKKNRVSLIFEDDLKVDYQGNLSSLLQQLILVSDFDLMYLGHCWESSAGRIITTIDGYALHHSKHALCTFGYIITFQGACNLLNYLDQHVTELPIDNTMATAYHQNVFRSISLYPPVISVMNFNSTIGYPQTQ